MNLGISSSSYAALIKVHVKVTVQEARKGLAHVRLTPRRRPRRWVSCGTSLCRLLPSSMLPGSDTVYRWGSYLRVAPRSGQAVPFPLALGRAPAFWAAFSERSAG